jgi:hypothetical protein
MRLETGVPALVVFAEFDRIGLSLVVEGLRALGIWKLEDEMFQQMCFI